jgi:hypothetical protein
MGVVSMSVVTIVSEPSLQAKLKAERPWAFSSLIFYYCKNVLEEKLRQSISVKKNTHVGIWGGQQIVSGPFSGSKNIFLRLAITFIQIWIGLDVLYTNM